jgi:hypothetical protein
MGGLGWAERVGEAWRGGAGVAVGVGQSSSGYAASALGGFSSVKRAVAMGFDKETTAI